MSDTSVSSDDPGAKAKPVGPQVPRTINLAIAAICAQVLFTVLRAVSMFGYTDQLNRLLIKSNNDLKVKDRKVPYGPSQIADDLHRVRVNSLWQGLVIAVALLLLAWSLRRVSTASVTRWALLIVMVMTGGPFSVIPAKGLPVVPQVALVLSGVAAIVAIVLLFVPDSRQYFREVSANRRGTTVAPAAGARPSLFSMLSQRGVGVSMDKGAADRSVPVSEADRAAARNRERMAKVKSRSDADAVARGAELARARAKASKSRRTEI